jgi:hypothetical protein
MELVLRLVLEQRDVRRAVLAVWRPLEYDIMLQGRTNSMIFQMSNNPKLSSRAMNIHRACVCLP